MSKAKPTIEGRIAFRAAYRNINLFNETEIPEVAGLIKGQAALNYNIAPGLPYPGFNTITLSENEANTHYNGLQMDLNSQLSHDLTLHAIYTVSHAVDPTTGGNGGGEKAGHRSGAGRRQVEDGEVADEGGWDHQQVAARETRAE